MLDKNLYLILGVSNSATLSEIKTAYRRLSFKYHPDKNSDKDAADIFKDISEAYSILSSQSEREEYDMKSRFGKNYNEYFELFNINLDFNYEDEKVKLDKFKKNEIDDIFININDDFNGSIEYERLIICKDCNGTGKDFSSKIVIKDKNGNVLKTFDSDDGCDFCYGTGKDEAGNICGFCQGMGKIGLSLCSKCNGKGRIAGKQKISNIKFPENEKRHKIEFMGNISTISIGKVGHLWLIKKSN